MSMSVSVFGATEEHILFMAEYRGISMEDPEDIGDWKPNEDAYPPNDNFARKTESHSIPATPPNDWSNRYALDSDFRAGMRSIEIFHRVLNQGKPSSLEANSFFRIWFSPRDEDGNPNHEAINIDEFGEQFAFLPSQVPALLTQVSRVTPKDVSVEIENWCRSYNEHINRGHSLGEKAQFFLVELFATLYQIPRSVKRREIPRWASIDPTNYVPSEIHPSPEWDNEVFQEFKELERFLQDCSEKNLGVVTYVS